MIEYGIIALLIFSPLPAASVHEWSILIIELAALLLAAAYLFMKDKPAVNESLLRSMRWTRILFAGFFLFLLVQIVPLPAFLIKVLSPRAYDFRNLYATDPGRLKLMNFSIVPSYSLQEALELLAYLLIGMLVILTITSKRQIYRLMGVAVASGVFQAFYGLFELSSNSPRILFYKKMYRLDSVTGTFVNRNHFSGYLEMIIPLAIGLAMARAEIFSVWRLSWRQWIVRLSEKGVSLNLLIALGIIVMAVAVVFSKSRSGISVLAFAFVFVLALLGLSSTLSGTRRKRIKIFLRTLVLLIIILSFGLGTETTLKRFALDDLLNERRPMYWTYTIRTFSQYPLVGTGLGTFGSLAPRFEGPSGPVSIGHAHNDYLEYASELGVLGFVLLFGGILFMAVTSWRVWRQRHDPEVKGLALGGIVSITSILLHSLTDFNLHIPANMLLFAVVLPLTVVTVFYRKEAAPQPRR